MKINKYFYNMIQQPHLLISGTTGSGKSVLLHHLINIIMLLDSAKMVLIDTKKVELYRYRKNYNTLYYVDNVNDTITILKKVIDIMGNRFVYLRKKGLKKLEDDPIYIIIDEFADLVLFDDKKITPLIVKIAQLGRAANIHLILATQRPTADIINKKISVNMVARVCLRVASAVDSRNVIGVSGGELLPQYGQGIYWVEGYAYNIEIPPPQPHTIKQKSNFNFKYLIYILLGVLFLFSL